MFSFGNISKLATGLGAVTGIITYYKVNKERNVKAQASHTDENFAPAWPKWDSNWDWRASSNPAVDSNNNEEVKKPTATRHIILIRHGQYNLRGETDAMRSLTALGREQAESTGKRLRELNLAFTSLVTSTMTRAMETGAIIHKYLPNLEIEACPLLEEGAPIPPEPPTSRWKPPSKFYQDGARIEAAYRKYFYRADPSQKEDSMDILVCHANVIRYFVCRALQYPAHGWLRLSLKHASITWLSILPSGRVLLLCMGDAGHMPPTALTTS